MEEGQKSEGFNLFGTFVKYDHLFLLMLLIAAYLRFNNSYIHNLWPDEARDAFDGYFLYKNPLDFMHIPSAMHPPVFPYLITLSYFILGFGENAARTVAPFMGTLGVAVLYFFGSRVFNKKIALLASLLLATLWLNVFMSTKILTDIIIGTVFSATMLAFYLAVEKPDSKFLGKIDYSYVAGVLLGISFLTKEVAYMIPLLFLAYLAATKRLGLLKNKKVLVAAGIAVLLFLPWAYRNTVISGDPFEIGKWKGQYAAGGAPDYLYYVKGSMSWFGGIETYLLAAGLLLLLLNANGRPEKFTLVWLLGGMLFFSWYGYKEPRFLMPIYPAFALAIAYVPEGLKKLAKMADGRILYALAAIIIIAVAASNATLATAQVAARASGYYGLRDAGEFIRQNTAEGDNVAAVSIKQIGFYSLRPTYSVPEKIDALEKLISEKNIKYVVLDPWEPYVSISETPAYLQNNTERFTLVKAFVDEELYKSQRRFSGALVYEVR